MSATMDEGDGIHNVFSSDHLWEQSTLFEETDVYQSSLFAPLQLDSRFCRVFVPARQGP